MILALTVAILFGGGVYLIQQRGMVRIVFGMSLIGHAANLTILYAGVPTWRGEAFPDRTPLTDAADPLPRPSSSPPSSSRWPPQPSCWPWQHWDAATTPGPSNQMTINRL